MSKPSAGRPIDEPTLNRALLARQLLLTRARVPVLRALEKLAGMQSQVPESPYVGLWSRLAGFRPEQLSDALLKRTAVRMVLMRSTVHLVTANDALAFRPPLQPMLEQRLFDASPFGKHLGKIDRPALEEAGRTLMRDKPHSLAELRAVLAKQWPQHDAESLAQALRTFLPLVQVTPRGVWGQGGLPRLTLLEHWLSRDTAKGLAKEALIRRYLAAFGPASMRDFQVWSGLRDNEAAFEKLAPTLTRFVSPRGIALYDLPRAPRPPASTPAPPRLLPEFDNLLLSHQDRNRVLRDDDRRHAFVGNLVLPSVLLDGRVQGSWTLTETKLGASLAISLFGDLRKTDRPLLEAEARGLLAFVAPQKRHDVEVRGG